MKLDGIKYQLSKLSSDNRGTRRACPAEWRGAASDRRGSTVEIECSAEAARAARWRAADKPKPAPALRNGHCLVVNNLFVRPFTVKFGFNPEIISLSCKQFCTIFQARGKIIVGRSY